MATRKSVIEISAHDKTRAGIESAKRNIKSLQSSATGAALKFGAIGAALSAALGVASLKGLIDAGDQLAKLNQKTGISVEQLSALKYAGALADVSVEELAKGLNKLAVNMSDAARGGTLTGAAFDAIGVKVKAAGGHLRNTDDVLGDIADKFASYEDGAEKAALATAIFGKGGAALIPFLNVGRAGLKDMADEAQRLGIIFSGDLARQSEAFNDNLTRMGALLDGLKMSILPGVVEWLLRMTNELLAGHQAFGSLGRAIVELGVKTPFGASYAEGARAARVEIEKLELAIRRAGGLQNPLTGAGGMNYEAQLNSARQRLAYFQSQQHREALAAGAGITDTRFGVRQDAPKKKKLPVMAAADAAAQADSLRAQQLAGALAALQASLKNETDLFAHHNKRLADLYGDGELSNQQYYDARAAAQRDFLATQNAGIAAEVAALKAHQAKLTKPAERAAVDNQIAAAYARQAAAAREAGQASEEAERARTRASRESIAAIYDLDAALAQLRGDDAEVARLAAAQQIAAAAATYKRAGGDHRAELQQLADLLRLQTDQSRIGAELVRLTERQAAAEESYLAIARASGTGLLEQERAIYALRSDALAQLEALVAAQTRLAEISGDPRALLAAQKLATTLAIAREQVDPTLNRLNAATDQFADNLARGAEEAIIHFSSLRDVIDSLGDDLLRLGTQILVTDPLREAAKGYFRGLTAKTGAADFVRGGPAVGTDAVKTLATSASAGTDALKGMADSLGLTTTALAAIPSAAATPLAVSFAAITAAAQSAAAALAALAAGAGSSAGSGILGSLGGAFSSSSAASSAQAAMLRAQFFHAGGIAGEGPERAMPASLFTDAPRFHGGGLAGDEVPAILRRGEEVLTAASPRHRDNFAPAPTIHAPITIVARDVESFRRSEGQITARISHAIARGRRFA